jgi:hypothetical protein
MSGNPNETPGNSGGNSGENSGNGGGPPAHAGPPERVREKISGTRRNNDGAIEVGKDPLQKLADNVDWDNLSPFEEYVLAVLHREGLIE